jgi:hypothetical protein
MSEESYLDILPDELNLMITSFLPRESISPPKYLSYSFYKLFFKDKTYEILFSLRYIEAYNFILKNKNIDGSASWKNLYYFFVYCENHHPTTYFESDQDYPYIVDIYYFYNMYKDFPKFYEQVHDINLDHEGLTYEDEGLTWKDVYVILGNISNIETDFIIKGIFSTASYMTMQVTLDMDEYVIDKLVYSLIGYVYLKNNTKSLDLRVLFNYFCKNFDMYENLCLITDKMVIKDRLDYQYLEENYPEHLFSMFIQDLKKRIV